MNEPAIFYTEDRLADTCAEIEKLTAGNMGIDEYFAFTGMVAGLNGNIGDYSIITSTVRWSSTARYTTCTA